MTRGTWLLLLLAIAMLAALVGVWRSGHTQNAHGLIERARERMAGPLDDLERFPGAMRELDLAIQLADAGGDTAAAREALLYRAELLESRGSLAQAAADLERLLEAHSPDDVELLSRLARCKLQLGDLAAALNGCERVLALEPKHAVAAALRGQVMFQQGLKQLEEVRAVLDDELSRTDADDGFKLAERIAALDPSDALRPALLHDLRALFPIARSAAADEAAKRIDEVAERWVQARGAFADSFARSVQPQAVYGLIDILYRSGRLIESVDFGLAVRNLPEAFDAQVLQILVLSMNALGRPKIASKLVGETPDSDQGLPFDFRLRLAKILYDSQLWNRLRMVGWHLHQFEPIAEVRQEARSFGDFYQGLAEVRDNAPTQGHTLLERYLGAGPLEPFPGAVAVAWAGMAEAERGFQRPLAERSAIEASISLEPRMSGEIWLRLADLQLEMQDPASNIERSLAHALMLLPEKAGELLPRWREAGALALLQQQRDTQLVWEELRRDLRWYPSRESSAYERLELARRSLEAGEAAGCYEACDNVLSEYPDLLPALDLAIEAQLALRRQGRAAELILRRLEAAGPAPASLEQLRGIPPTELTTRQTLALMRADPRHSGIMFLGRYQVARGGGERVLSGLLYLGFDELGDPGRLLAARILINLQRDVEALPLLSAIAPDGPLASAALRLRVEVAARSGQRDELATVFQQLRERSVLDPAELLPAARLLLEHGLQADALELARILDQNPSTRGAPVLQLRSQLELLSGQPAEARVGFERLRALTDDGAAEFGLLLIAIDERAWTEVPALIEDLEQTRARSTELSRACRLALSERLDEARSLALGQTALPAAAPEWKFVAAAISRLQRLPTSADSAAGATDAIDAHLPALFGSACIADPRDLLGLLLLAEQPGFESLCALRARAWSAPDCGPVAALLLGRLAMRAGDDRVARLALRQALQREPRLISAWDGLEEIQRGTDGDPENPLLLSLQVERRVALGETKADDPFEILQRAHTANERGGTQAILPWLSEAAERHKEQPILTLEVARARMKLGDWAGALESWSRYAQLAAPSSLERRAEEWIQLIERAAQGGHIGPARAKAELEALALRLPDHPLVALARAGAELRALPHSPAIGIGRAFALLDGWRKQHGQRPINSLLEGAARRWFEFYVEVDPRRAEQFATHELELDPGDLEPWLMIGEALRAQGRLDEALLQFDVASTMIPEGRILRLRAEIIADLGRDHMRVEQMIERTRQMEGTQKPDPSLAFLRARSLVNTNPGTLPAGIELLIELWSQRVEIAAHVSEAELGLQLGTALMHRLVPGDARRAALVLAQVQDKVTDPMRRDLIRAIGLIARRVDETEREAAQTSATDTPGQ